MASVSTWIGVDPGGDGNFGVAILDHSIRTTRVGCTDEAIKFLKHELCPAPSGIGIDAPLWWSSGPAAGRRADQWLRDTYRLPGGEVQQSNSLRGAVLVQGAMFVVRIRELFPDAPITEAHPKAVLKVHAKDDWETFADQYDLVDRTRRNDHERDAIIAAVAAREGFEGRWPHDLSKERYASELDPSRYWLNPVHYFWPE